MKLWEEKLDREAIRRKLLDVFEAQSEGQGFMELWAYRAGENVRLDGEVIAEEDGVDEHGTPESAALVYRRIDPETLRRTRISAIWRGDAPLFTDALEYYAAHTREELRYAAITGTTTSLFIESDSLIHKLWRTVNGGSGVYFTVGAPGGTSERDELFYANMSGKSTGAVSVAHGVNHFYRPYRDGIALGYIEGDRERFVGVVSVAQDGSVRLSNASPAAKFSALENEGQVLLEYDPWQQETATGTLWLHEGDLTGGNQKIVSPDVVSYDYRSPQLIYFERFTGEDSPPDLYVWRGSEAKLIGQASNVVSMVDEE
jgi:hypothetical protein